MPWKYNQIFAVGSILYNGGGGSNALQTKTTSATLVASGAAVLPVRDKNLLDLWLMNSTAAQSCTLLIGEFSAATPTVATCVGLTEIPFGTADQTCTVDRAVFGLATGVEYAPKTPIRLNVTPGSYLMIVVSASLGGVWYCRYQLHAQ